ncbi:cell surface protein SprA [Gangjinia marincola]|uniref:Cell surface protein SprA n=2 Tax=Gangjinia marincola TaxID=578463 RepID=A0ABP3XQA4_9FLAO
MWVQTGISQVTKPQDSTQTRFKLGKIELPDPTSIQYKYTYDPILDRYIYQQTLGEFNISYPLILTPTEYQNLLLKEQMRDYFKTKFDAVSGQKEGAEEERKNLLPVFYVKSGLFESIFGGKEIEVIPTGQVAMDLGVLFTRQDNPSFSPRNRSNFTFDFDQRIGLSLLGTVGTRLQVTANYDTEATFSFQDQIKLEYTPTEDDIIQKIEAGNVNMPLNSSLIQGAQALFGLKTQLQFGRTTITGVFAEQNSQRQSVNVEGGATIQNFERFILDYDEDRHFFLSHYFRDVYDRALENYPFINSNVQITRLEVWVTNRTTNPQTLLDARNIVAIQDLGEADPSNIGVLLDANGNLQTNNPNLPSGFVNASSSAFPSNSNNDFNPFGITGPEQSVLTQSIRDIAFVNNTGFGAAQGAVEEGVDYGILENARQLGPNEYRLNTQLGYISLNQRLVNDEILGVAFQYTVNGRVYQVGEFANDGVDAQGINGDLEPNDGDDDPQLINQSLIVKMLKSPLVLVNEPRWDLMMKNIYNLGASGLEQDGFRLNVLYTDPQPLNYLENIPEPDPTAGDVRDQALLRVFNLDNLNATNDPINGGDGFFDFVPGLTIDPQNGNMIFTSVEPFGEYLFNQLGPENGSPGNYNDPNTYNEFQQEYVYREMYETTKIDAENQAADKNKFQIKGRYKSSQINGIPLGAFNVPPGSVTVTAGGRVLQEGVDYTVNYQAGVVQILDQSLLASNTPVQVSTENNALFGQQTKRFTGIDIQHQINEDFIVGGTFLSLNERPITQKSNVGVEPINNSIFGVNLNYATEVPFLTRLVNKLPNIDTDVESNFSLRGEFAYLLPGSPDADDFRGETTSYVDDFEASQTSISMLSPLSWELSSPPLNFGGEITGDISSNNKRARLAWYNIDPIFYSNQRPDGISDEDLSRYDARRVFIDEIFPVTDIVAGQTQAIFSLDLAYFPQEKGQYNYDTNNTFSTDPRENFGGITRQINTTNFEQSNVEFIEFWVMDPFLYDDNTAAGNDGKIVFNLGNISEDVLPDGRKQFENGLPDDGSDEDTIETIFGKVPTSQSLVYAFDTEGAARTNQDVGFDGIDDATELDRFGPNGNPEDPANDNYAFYLAESGGIVDRYKRYNNTQGNSPTEVTQTNRGSTTVPTVEDVNRDNTMNTINSYFEYEVPIYPGITPEDNTGFVSAVIDKTAPGDGIVLANGQELPVRWIQYRVPLRSPLRNSIGGISDLRSIRFIRMFLTGFQQDLVLRFGTLDLVRGDYRRYTEAIVPDGSDPDVVTQTTFEVEAVSEEVTPGYRTPPGIVREEVINNNTRIREDEQSLAINIKDLQPDDSRAVIKNFQVDMRQYERLEMFLHAESFEGLDQTADALEDNEMVAFIRMGIDFTENFYQIELPLEVSPQTSTNPSAREMWPEANEMSVPLELLQQIKSIAIADGTIPTDLVFYNRNAEVVTNDIPGELRVGIKGNPSFGNIRVIMLGVKNANDPGENDISGNVWFNELRLVGLENEGGWASVVSMDTNLADFATISATGRMSTIGFGSLEQGPNQRSLEDVQQYDVVTSVNAGQLLPKKWGINIPLSYNRGEELITPKFDPIFLDLELENRIDAAPDVAPVNPPDGSNIQTKDEILEQAENYTRRQNVSLIGLRKDRVNPEDKARIYDIENFVFSASYSQQDHRDFEIEEALDQNVNVGATYGHNFKPITIEPLQKVADSISPSKYLDIIRDFNVNLLPTSISASSNILRDYNERQFRSITGGVTLPLLQQRNYLFDWQYAIDYKVFQSLNVNFTASNNRIVRNFINEENEPRPEIGIWDGFFDVGEPNQHYQNLQANYELPLSKIPALSFLKATYSYTGSFQWQRGSEILDDLEGIPDLGNTIQNSNQHQINASLDFNRLYKYAGLEKKRANRRSSNRNVKKQGVRDGDGNKPGTLTGADDKTAQDNKPTARVGLSGGDKARNTFISILTAVKKLQVSYEESQGTFVPGYLQDIGFVGTLKPSLGFTFGSQADIRNEAARRGWLTLYDQFNEQYTEVENRNLNLQATVDLLPGLKIDVNGNRLYNESYTENYKVLDSGEYQSLTPNTFGTFSISSNLIRTAFSQSNAENSAPFEDFRENRREIAFRLAQEAGIDTGNPDNLDDDGFPLGFGQTSQRVLLPAFVAAYSGSDASNVSLGATRDVPLPNWDIKYTGFMRKKWFKKRFKRFSLQHGYRSTYSINQFQTNLDFNRRAPFAESNKDQNGNFKNRVLYSAINLTEQFSPLLRIDMEMKNSVNILAEMRKDRALSLSFDNNLLTEIQGNEYILGLGYRIKDLKINTRFGGKKRILSSDLRMTADVSLRQNETIVRYLDLEDSQTTAGQDLWSINLGAQYALTTNLEALFYYDHTFSSYAISTAFPQTTIRGGFTLIYNFGN